MKVILIHQAFASPKDPGGTRHFEFARRSLAEGVELTIVASDLAYKTGKKVIERRGLYAEEVQDGVRILRAYTHPSIHRSYFWRVIAFLGFMFTSFFTALRAGSIDLVMGTSPPIFQAVSAWLVSLLRRKPFLYEIRDLWPEFAIQVGVLTNPILIALSRWLERFLYSRATMLVVNSPAYHKYLIEKGIPEDKICIIPNGVDPSMFDPEDRGEDFRRELGLEGKFVATYAGALGLANDIPSILRAADRLRNQPEVEILLVGEGKERAELEEMARDLALPNVTFMGPRPKSQMAEILAASDAGLATLKDIPMFRTTYPNKVFDYMAAGRPTVLAIDGVIREVVEAAKGGIFVPPGDDVALAQALQHLSEHATEAREMGVRARKYVQAHFDRADQADQFISLVRSLTPAGGE
ncbi:MAG: glycosyltransferase family 4 protein [Anaerolineales bacterium]